MEFIKYKEAAEAIKNKVDIQPRIGLILGSGLGVLADEIKNPVIVPYHDIPHYPQSTVEGHAGELVVGFLGEVPVLAMKGRFHYYEGYSQQQVTFPVRVMKLLGVESILVTNAAGGLNPSFHPGDFMLINDHINFTGNTPLMGPNDEKFGPRFPDMSEAYNLEYREIAKSVAESLGIPLKEGVYFGFSGPNYETPAEVKMAAILGGDAVGMSTVPEVIVAKHCGLKVIGISTISNMAAGIQAEPLSHKEVIETTERVRPDFINLVKEIVNRI